MPSSGRILPTAGVNRGEFFVFSGASLSEGANGSPTRTYLRDTWRYSPDKGWRQGADMPRAAVAAPSPAIPAGHDFLVVIGGSDGALDARTDELRDEHPGFPDQSSPTTQSLTAGVSAANSLPCRQSPQPPCPTTMVSYLPAAKYGRAYALRSSRLCAPSPQRAP